MFYSATQTNLYLTTLINIFSNYQITNRNFIEVNK